MNRFADEIVTAMVVLGHVQVRVSIVCGRALSVRLENLVDNLLVHLIRKRLGNRWRVGELGDASECGSRDCYLD